MFDLKDQELASRHGAPILWPWLMVVAAWTVALLAALTHQSYLIDHYYLLEESHLPILMALAVFLACWQVMTVGMMLPSSMPILYIVVHASRRQKYTRRIQVAFMAGYALVWTLFGVAAFLGDTQVHRLVYSWFWLYTHPWLIGAATFTVAGVFQFSPLKTRCLEQCCSPLNFFARYYRRRGESPWLVGLHHGICSLGCSWALMLVMFALGTGSLVWMAVLTGVMIAEETFPGNHRLSQVIGIGLLLLAALWLAHPAWLPNVA